MSTKAAEKTILLKDTGADFWGRAQAWGSRFDYCMIFNGNEIPYPMGAFPKMIMAGNKRGVEFSQGTAFTSLKSDRDLNKTWLCGYFGYDLKNEIERLQSMHDDFTKFPDMCFFEPEHILIFEDSTVRIISDTSAETLLQNISSTALDSPPNKSGTARLIRSVKRETYLKNVEHIREHILNGDMYEMNYCIDFGLSDVNLNPFELYQSLMRQSPTPFSCFGRFKDHYLICASPERFLRKNGNVLLSQPIKGTARRKEDPEADSQVRQELYNSEKERAENMMIVDLVRNDLSKSAITGSVKVPELFGIYSFRHLHQMISSVTADLRPGTHIADVIMNAFPMGSMTGAPKVKVMELIEQYESAKRGIYSGAAGFFTPEGDFDLNVVIRSLAYNSQMNRLSFSVGSAITYDSNPEQEYEECLLKARAILDVLAECGIQMPDLTK